MVERPDRSAIIAGSGSGIGRAVARDLAARGYALTLVGRRRDALIETAALLTGEAARARIWPLDLSDATGHEEAVSGHLRDFGGVDGLVISSGIYRSAPLLNLADEDWSKVFETNFTGTRRLVGAVLPQLLRRGQGRIVFIGSVIAQQSEPGSAAYSASKAAMHSLARSIAVDYGAQGISANTIAPGWVDTPMAAEDIDELGVEGMRKVNPMGRAATAEEIGNVAAYLVDQAPAFLNGSVIAVDGGQSIIAPAT